MSTRPTPLPLTGKTVLVTQPDAAVSHLSQQLVELGAEVFPFPLIRIIPVNASDFPDEQNKIVRAFDSFGEFETLVFVSKTGVDEFHRLYIQHAKERDLSTAEATASLSQHLADRSVFAIGKGTGSRVETSLGVEPILPPVANSQSLAETLIESNRVRPLGKVMILRANRGSEVLPTKLAEAEVDFCELVAYISKDVESLPTSLHQRLDANQIDWITVTSSAIARSVQRMFGQWLSSQRIQLVSISPTSTQTLHEVGLRPTAEATTYDAGGVAEAIHRHTKQGRA